MNEYVTSAELIESINPFVPVFMFCFFVCLIVVLGWLFKALIFITEFFDKKV